MATSKSWNCCSKPADDVCYKDDTLKMKPTDNKLKVAVTMEKQTTLFLELNQTRPLAAFIQGVCDQWHLPDPDDYALRFDDKDKKGYITERTRTEIKVGQILKLSLSVSKTAHSLLEKLQTKNSEAKRFEALHDICEVSDDVIFAQEFIAKKGHCILVQHIEAGSYTEEFFILLLQTCLKLMENTTLPWDIFEIKFIRNVAYVVNRDTVPNLELLQCALEILEAVILHSPDRYNLVSAEVKISSLVKHLEVANATVQKNIIALINSLYLRGNEDQISKLYLSVTSNSIRNVILNNIIRTKSLGKEMEHQLYVLQCLMFSQLNMRKRTKVAPNDQNALKEITQLRRVAFDAEPDSTSRKQSHAKDYSRLGFTHSVNPLEDFMVTPPGVLALDNMAYFSKMHGEEYTKVVLENSCKSDEHDCPFAKASIQLTNMLCEVLKIGEQPTDDGQDCYPMFFSHDRPFEEFYCICVQLLNRTWKEMKATSLDFHKVLSVVREQLTRALIIKPKTFEDLRSKLATLTYSDITSLWQQERKNQEEFESQAKPIVELREKIRPEIMEFIRKQRLHHLVQGTMFRKYAKGGIVKGKFWFCCLSLNHKHFLYGECEEDKKPNVEHLPNKLSVEKITSLVVGKDCIHMKETKKESERVKRSPFAFSIISNIENAESLNFYAPTTGDYHIWVDGINALLGNNMQSEQTSQDLEMLLSMELKIRLLDIEGIQIPDVPPPIPNEPPNYDFFIH